jgi:hypothetical protein
MYIAELVIGILWEYCPDEAKPWVLGLLNLTEQ